VTYVLYYILGEQLAVSCGEPVLQRALPPDIPKIVNLVTDFRFSPFLFLQKILHHQFFINNYVYKCFLVKFINEDTLNV